MRSASSKAALIASSSLVLRLTPRGNRAGWGAIYLPAIALPAHPHRRSTASAQEQPSWLIVHSVELQMSSCAAGPGATVAERGHRGIVTDCGLGQESRTLRATTASWSSCAVSAPRRRVSAVPGWPPYRAAGQAPTNHPRLISPESNPTPPQRIDAVPDQCSKSNYPVVRLENISPRNTSMCWAKPSTKSFSIAVGVRCTDVNDANWKSMEG